MSTRKQSHHQERHIRIRSVRKQPPDLKKLASALIALAQAQAEMEAQAEADRLAKADREKPGPAEGSA